MRHINFIVVVLGCFFYSVFTLFFEIVSLPFRILSNIFLIIRHYYVKELKTIILHKNPGFISSIFLYLSLYLVLASIKVHSFDSIVSTSNIFDNINKEEKDYHYDNDIKD